MGRDDPVTSRSVSAFEAADPQILEIGEFGREACGVEARGREPFAELAGGDGVACSGAARERLGQSSLEAMGRDRVEEGNYQEAPGHTAGFGEDVAGIRGWQVMEEAEEDNAIDTAISDGKAGHVR